MNRFKNVELAEMYKVSEKSIRNWIDAAKKNKLNLQLIKEEDKAYIANTPSNHILMKDLAQKGKKFKNKRSLKIVSPKKEFYEIYSENQIIEIIKNLEVNHEIPLKYSYVNGGANSWDRYAKEIWNKNEDDVTPNTKELLDFDTEYIYSLIKKYKKVNIVDIGPGNALPIKEFLQHLISKKLLRKYIAIDYSEEMLKIAEKNLKAEFGKDFPYESCRADITSESFESILFKNSLFDGEDVSCINLVFYIGGTIENDKLYSQQLNIINKSMGKFDIFVLEQGLATENVKLRLTFGSDISEANKDLQHRKMVLDLLNIKEDYYDVERIYSEVEKAKVIKVVFKNDLKIKFEHENFNKIVSFNTKDYIIIWRYNSHCMMEVINEMTNSGFEILHISKSMDEESVMMVSKVKSLTN